MTMLNGTFEGPVTGAKWTEWDNNGVSLPMMQIDVQVQTGDEFVTLRPALFFDNEIIDRGNDAGKTRMEVSMEVLSSMGCTVDAVNPGNNAPDKWPEELKSATASCYCIVKEDDEGKEHQRVYLNRRGRPAISDDRVKELWGMLAGGVAESRPEPSDSDENQASDDSDNLPF